MEYEKIFKGNEETVKICREVALEQQKEGKPNDQILSESIKFILNELKYKRSIEIQRYNKMVQKGIKGLASLEQWGNLIGIANDSLQKSHNILQKSHNILQKSQDTILQKAQATVLQKVTKGIKIELEVLSIGTDNFKDIFKESFLNKFE